MPTGARWPHVFGIAMMGGIGFTMSLFVTGLAFKDHPDLATASKIGILSGSLVSALGGMLLLRMTGSAGERPQEDISVSRVDVPRFADAYSVHPWPAAAPLLGRTLAQINLRRDHGITVIGVFREQQGAATSDGAHYRKLDTVDADYVIAEGDTLLLVGERPRLDAFLAGLAAMPASETPG
jgi:hypothetical protein